MAFCTALSTPESLAADRGTLERMVKGDPEALGQLYDRHGRVVYSLALRIVRDQGDAEDIVQEVFSQVWGQASRYDASRGSVLGWLLTVARSRSIDRLRVRRSRPEPAGDDHLLNDLPDLAGRPDDQLVWTDQAREIRAALESLALLQRVAIELAFFEGLTHAEIAARLELPLGTVKTRIRQGLLTLRARLAGGRE